MFIHLKEMWKNNGKGRNGLYHGAAKIICCIPAEEKP
jgi:hypothetical protein